MIRKFEEPKDRTTENIYKQAKYSLMMVKGRIQDLKPEVRKYFQDMQVFVDMYEFGSIKHWYEFFKRKEEYFTSDAIASTLNPSKPVTEAIKCQKDLL